MRYNHYLELPIGAFEPICGRMKLFGGGGNPIDSFSNVISDLGGSINNAVSDVGGTIGDLGNQIDQSVNSAVPGGWATVGAAALAAATLGGSLAADGALAAAPELDATGTLAEQGAALQGTTVGAGLTDTGLSMIPPDTPPPITDTGLSMVPPETPVSSTGAPIYDYSPTTAVTNASPELDATGSLSQQALQAPVYDYSPTTPVQNVSPELDPTGSMVTGTSASDVTNALRAANTAKNLLTSVKPTTTTLTTTPTTQNNQALANMLKATQGQQTALPPIYKQGNPFFYSQQQQPIQDNLASLLRNNYGNS